MSLPLLDVYYFIDNKAYLDSTIDNTLLHNALKWYFDTKIQDFKLNKFEHYPITIPSDDTLMQSFIYMRILFDKLKLKTINETWFIYISSGDIKGFDKETGLIMINKKPGDFLYLYNIKPQNYKIHIQDNKTNRDKKISYFVKLLHETLISPKLIRAPPI